MKPKSSFVEAVLPLEKTTVSTLPARSPTPFEFALNKQLGHISIAVLKGFLHHLSSPFDGTLWSEGELCHRGRISSNSPKSQRWRARETHDLPAKWESVKTVVFTVNTVNICEHLKHRYINEETAVYAGMFTRYINGIQWLGELVPY